MAVVAILAFAGLLWASDEPWKTKPYQQWDKADIELVLNNSPWCKKITVDVNWKPINPASVGKVVVPDQDQNVELRNHMETQKGGMPDTSPPDASMTSMAPGGSKSPQTAFTIRWYSSRVVREALAREAVLNGRISEAQGAQLLAEPVTDYEVIVFGPDMTPFQILSEDQLKSETSLEGKQSKQKVAPATVRINKAPNGMVTGVIFLFPKKTAGGEDVASTNEKGFEFACKVKGLDLHNTFDAHKMIDEKGEDF